MCYPRWSDVANGYQSTPQSLCRMVRARIDANWDPLTSCRLHRHDDGPLLEVSGHTAGVQGVGDYRSFVAAVHFPSSR